MFAQVAMPRTEGLPVFMREAVRALRSHHSAAREQAPCSRQRGLRAAGNVEQHGAGHDRIARQLGSCPKSRQAEHPA